MLVFGPAHGQSQKIEAMQGVKMRNLDQLDLDILAHLFRDAGMTNKDLAALVGVALVHLSGACASCSRMACSAGALRGGSQALGGHIQAMVSCNWPVTAARSSMRLRDAIPALPEGDQPVPHGRRVMISWCTCSVSDTEHLRNFVFDHFTSRGEVVHLETSLVFEHRFSRSLPCFPTPDGASCRKPPEGGSLWAVPQLRASRLSCAVR